MNADASGKPTGGERASVLKAHLVDASPIQTLERDSYLVAQVETHLFAVELFGRSTRESVENMIRDLDGLRVDGDRFGGVLLIDGIDGYDAELRYIYGDEELKGKIGYVTVVVTSDPLSKMIIGTMALGAGLFGGRKIFAAGDLKSGLALARKHLGLAES